MRLVVLAIVTIVLLGAVMTVVHFGSFRPLRRHRAALLVGVLALVVFDMAARWVATYLHVGEGVSDVLGVVLIALAISAIPVAAVVVLSWAVARLVAWRRPRPRPSDDVHPPRQPGDPSPGVTRRQVVEAAGGAAILGATGSALAWGALRGRFDFQLVEVPVRIAGLPRTLDGYVIAQVSDIHAGVHVGERMLGDGIELVRRAKADLLVVTGDLVDANAAFAPSVARKLADSAPRDGAFVILGDHDHYAGAPAVLAALRAAGLTTLVNEGRAIRPGDGGGFALLGLEDLWARRDGRKGPDLERALAGVPEDLPRILLSHQPQTVDEWAGRVALQLSGHTHGGQINPGIRPADLFFRYVAGMYPVKGTSLYVNRGFGTVGPPARLGAPPEITRFVLVAA